MVSIHGRSHTSANLDLEIDQESKNKDIARNAFLGYQYKLTFRDRVCMVIILKMTQKVPGKGQNNRTARRM